MTPVRRARWNGPRSWAGGSWSYGSPAGEPSPGSTASGARRSTRCAPSSGPMRSRPSPPSRRPSTPRACSIPGRLCRPWPAAPSSGPCTSTRERFPLLTSTVSEDLGEALADRVRDAAARKAPLKIVGGNTKAFYGRRTEGQILDVSGHRGLIAHEPSELVITARAGTPLAEIEPLLAGHGQRLAFEPLALGEPSTIGGAAGLGAARNRRRRPRRHCGWP